MSGPYDAKDNPSHPGPQGKAYNDKSPPEAASGSPDDAKKGDVPVGMPVDSPGTGTLPPDQQGTENQAQPAGLAETRDYGIEPSAVGPETIPEPPSTDDESTDDDDFMDDDESEA